MLCCLCSQGAFLTKKRKLESNGGVSVLGSSVKNYTMSMGKKAGKAALKEVKKELKDEAKDYIEEQVEDKLEDLGLDLTENLNNQGSASALDPGAGGNEDE